MPRFNAPLEGQILGESKAPSYTQGERWDAALKLGNMDTAAEMFGFSWLDKLMGNQNPMEYMEKNDPIGKLEPEELNKRFPNMEIPFDKPTSYLVANELHERATEKKKLQKIVSDNGNNEQGFFSMSTLGAIAQHATDPLEVGADILIGLSTAGAGYLLGGATKFMKSANHARKAQAISGALKANTFTKSAIEGLGANAVIETQLYKEKAQVNEEYSLNDAFISTVAGGLAMPVMAFGGAKLMKHTAPTAKMLGRSFKSAYAQMSMGKRIDLSAIADSAKAIRKGVYNGDAPDFRTNFQFKEIDKIDFKSDSIYISRQKANNDIDISNHNSIDEFHGETGVHATTNPNEAHNIAAQFNEQVGDVIEVNLNKANLYDLDNPIDSIEGVNIAGKLDDTYAEAFLDAKTVGEGMTNVKELAEANGLNVNEVSDLMHSTFKENGYDGVIKTRPNEAQDLYIYDPENLNVKGKHKVKPNETGKVSEDVLKNSKKDLLENKQRDIFHNEHVMKELEEAKAITPEKLVEQQTKEFGEQKQLLKEQVESGMGTKEDIQLLKEMEEVEMLGKAEDGIFKKFVSCILKGGL